MQSENGAAESPEQVYARVFRLFRPRTPLHQVVFEYRKSAGVTSSIEWKEGRLAVRISDLFAHAPPRVQESLAHLLIARLFRKRVPREFELHYRRFLNSRDAVKTAERNRKERGRKRMLPPAGAVYDLVAIFEDLNFRFFHGLMARPELGWSPGLSRTLLGHYDPAHHVIVLSRLLDRPEVPRLVVEYVLYHEMLHLRFPTEYRRYRRCIHTAEFRLAEDTFPGVAEAKQLLERICRDAWNPRARRR